jgi:hypothetical protein
MPMSGRRRAWSSKPTAFNIARAGARLGPATRLALRRGDPESSWDALMREGTLGRTTFNTYIGRWLYLTIA